MTRRRVCSSSSVCAWGNSKYSAFKLDRLLVRSEYATLPVAIYDRLGRPGAAMYGQALALAVVLMLLTALVMLLLQRRGRSEF